jgi:hypothetical protein
VTTFDCHLAIYSGDVGCVCRGAAFDKSTDEQSRASRGSAPKWTSILIVDPETTNIKLVARRGEIYEAPESEYQRLTRSDSSLRALCRQTFSGIGFRRFGCGFRGARLLDNVLVSARGFV